MFQVWRSIWEGMLPFFYFLIFFIILILQYTCLICNLFDDEDKNQYHCDGCGICRVGGRGRFFHCEVCNMCLPLQLKIDGHRCVENVSRSNCPVCLEDIHTSRIPCHIPDCGHLLHRTCFEELLSSGVSKF